MFFFKKKKTGKEEINKNPKTGSFFRDWVIANNVKTKLRKTRIVNEETIFYAFMCILSWFGQDSREGTEETKIFFDNSKFKDAALFEFAVFLYLNIDIWFFDNNRSKRNLIADYLQKRFLELALMALPTHEVTQIFNNRLDFYGGLIREGKGKDILEHYLPELIGFTLKDNTLRDNYNPDEELLLLGAIESFNIKIQSGETYTHGMKYIVKVLKDYK